MGKDYRQRSLEGRALSVCPLPLEAEVWTAGPWPFHPRAAFLWAHLPSVSCLPLMHLEGGASRFSGGKRLRTLRPHLWMKNVSAHLPWVGVACRGPEACEPLVDSAKLLPREVAL